MTRGTYKSSRKSSTVRPHCLRISANVPLATSLCSGTTVLKTRSAVRFSKERWLPFWRNSTKPARFSARTTRSPETLGNFGISVRDFDGGPKRFAFGRGTFGKAPSFQVQLDGFAEASAGTFNVASLRRDIQLRAAGYVPAVFFGDQHGESVRHNPMLTDVARPSKLLEPSVFTSY